MSSNDDHLMVAHSLIDLRRGNGSGKESIDKNPKDGCGKGTAIIKASYKSRHPIRDKSNKQNDDVGATSNEASYKSRHPLRDRSNVPLTKQAGVVTIEAREELTLQPAISRDTMKY
jgi:hypothetical protein